jgi:FkbM family methyltransferase
MTILERLGLWRSWLFYYGKPFNRKKLRRFYSNWIRPGYLIFDIGAHVGHRSQVFLDLGARVIAVEPQPACAEYLKVKFAKNPRFQLIEKLIHSHTAPIQFKVNSLAPTISTARQDEWANEIHRYSFIKTKWDNSRELQTITLDQLIRQHGIPYYIKIDTEGFEWEAIQGLSQPIELISLEYLAFDIARIRLAADRIHSLGNYLINFTPRESLKWLWPQWIQIHEFNAYLDQGLGYSFGDIYFHQKP